jgi:hypothetical protein
MTQSASATVLSKSRPFALRNTLENDNYFTILERILRQVQDQLGVNSGGIDIGPVIEQAYIAGVAAGAEANRLSVSTAVDYQAYSSVLVEATSALAVTVNTEPDDGEKVTVQHNAPAGAFIDIVYNGTIDTLVNNGDCITMEYSLELDKWVIV